MVEEERFSPGSELYNQSAIVAESPPEDMSQPDLPSPDNSSHHEIVSPLDAAINPDTD